MKKILQDVEPLNLLLVEDNFINQELARAVFGKQGHNVQIVENGEEALEALVKEDYDVIMMDVQMPVLDGHATTRLIRLCEQTENPKDPERQEILDKLSLKIYGGHIPIVAMTANVMPGDMEKCLDSGMDYYIGKPFFEHDVLQALSRVTKKNLQNQSQALGDEPEKRDENTASLEPVDLQQVRLHLTEKYKLPAEKVDFLMDGLQGALAEEFNRADLALQEKDMPVIVRVAHTIKGSLLNLGATGWAEKARVIELSAKAGEQKDYALYFQELREGLALLLDES